METSLALYEPEELVVSPVVTTGSSTCGNSDLGYSVPYSVVVKPVFEFAPVILTVYVSPVSTLAGEILILGFGNSVNVSLAVPCDPPVKVTFMLPLKYALLDDS